MRLHGKIYAVIDNRVSWKIAIYPHNRLTSPILMNNLSTDSRLVSEKFARHAQRDKNTSRRKLRVTSAFNKVKGKNIEKFGVTTIELSS